MNLITTVYYNFTIEGIKHQDHKKWNKNLSKLNLLLLTVIHVKSDSTIIISLLLQRFSLALWFYFNLISITNFLYLSNENEVCCEETDIDEDINNTNTSPKPKLNGNQIRILYSDILFSLYLIDYVDQKPQTQSLRGSLILSVLSMGRTNLVSGPRVWDPWIRLNKESSFNET